LTSSLKKVPPKGHRRLQGSNKKLHNQPVGYHLKLDLFLSAQWGPLQLRGRENKISEKNFYGSAAVIYIQSS
ncbi:MAG: hypothetical protein K9G39_09445, partial [Chlorobium sp.]|uniref:hypothetical protein n=1 Tax=Chlorobium sp. TaxID=1095 RepID=UPI0025C56C2A